MHGFRPVLAPSNPGFRGSENEAVFSSKKLDPHLKQVIPEISF